MSNRTRKALLIVLSLVLITISVFLIIQGVWYNNLDHTLQLQESGFVKDDITMLTFAQSAARVCCWLFGIGSGFVGLGLIGVAFDIIEFK